MRDAIHTTVRLTSCVLLLASWTTSAQPITNKAGQPYPERPITLLHAYSPGSSSGVILRTLSEFAGKSLGQRFVIEDRPCAISWAPLVEAGKMRVLTILSAKRVKRWPDIPVAKEQGFDINAGSSYGIGGPKGMEPKIVKLLHDAFRKGLNEPEFLKVVERYDTVTSYMNTEDYTRWAREQYAIEKTVVEKFGLKP